MAQLEVTDFAQAVIERMGECKDARFKQVMSALVKHAHAFMREVDLTPEEWMAGIQFLTETGKKCDEKRQEFILLSDTLGISMLVVALDQARGARALADRPGERPTEATVQGPFFWPGAPKKELGADIGEGFGEPTLYHGRVTDTFGKAVADCVLDVWSGDEGGLYDMQKGHEMSLRAQFRTDKEGNYRFWSIKPTYYPVPGDGPVGRMLDKMGRHLNRPGHMHMMLEAPGHQKLVTHIFVKDSPYLDSDAVFGVRNSLVVDFPKHPPGKAPDGRTMDKPFYTAKYDFRLVPKAG
ncbi:hydroxyquinol 1,2-dioxygenase [Ramlibacter ginsenosidimutans]|uniref:Hydroxyquinol 1,2-dioxygenase n=1 Tax=Ramlibacter ginsenosidimutans TaxID=502333 RepID=A0A934TPX7_9BURK|nr:dioxygenase [Ramlibacter ginsenosidimutans]MBK6005115.1 hydroxyquinol 1,2-dioxygenase [Ramlibacter ginsenosidimutans]